MALTYYVDATNGDDDNVGYLESAPWQTIAKVNTEDVAGTLIPGSTIRFKCGETWSGTQLLITDSGISTDRIILDSYGTGDAPILENAGVLPSYTRIIRINGDYVTVQNLYLRDCHDACIFITGNYNTIQDCEMSDGGRGVWAWEADHITITRNHIHDMSTIKDVVGSCTGPKGISIRGSDITISNNVIEDTLDSTVCHGAASGNAVEFWSDGITMDGIIISQNWFESAGSIELIGDSSFIGSEIKNVEIYSNVFHNNRRWIWIHKSGGALNVDIDNIQVYANTVIEEALEVQRTQIVGFSGTGPGPTATEFLLYNNLIYGRQGPDPDPDNFRRVFFTPGAMTHENNLYDYDWTLFSNVPAFTPDSTEIVGDAGLTLVAGNEFRPLITSSAIDAGQADGLTEDYDDEVKPRGVAADIGAYEYQGYRIQGVEQDDEGRGEQGIASPVSIRSGVDAHHY